MGRILSLVIAALLIVACGEEPDAEDAAADPDPEPDVEVEVESDDDVEVADEPDEAGETDEAQEAAEAEPPDLSDHFAAAPEVAFDPVEVSGTGAQTVELDFPEVFFGALRVTHQGQGSFDAQLVDDPAAADVPDARTGPFEAHRPLGPVHMGQSWTIEVEADDDADWTLAVVPLIELPVVFPGGQLDGQGWDTFLVAPVIEGQMQGHLTYDGDGELVMVVNTEDDDVTVVEESGPIDRAVELPPGAVMGAILGEGQWTLALDD